MLICQSCSFSPFAKQNKTEVSPRFQSLLKLLLWTKGVEWVKVSMPWVRCAFGNVSRPILRPILFKTAIETLHETKSFQSVTCISLENNVSTARTLKLIDCTLTFYLEICELPRLFLSQILHHTWYLSFFYTGKIFGNKIYTKKTRKLRQNTQ